MKKALIFTISTGQGHNQAAFSLAGRLESGEFIAEVIEPVRETSRTLNILMDDGYNIMTNRVPKMWGSIYKISSRRRINGYMSGIFYRTLRRTLTKIINKEKPDLIISTHLLLTNPISSVLEKENLSIPFVSVVTDYDAHTFYINEKVSAYIVGNDFTRKRLLYKGVTEEKIYTYGIPVRKEFTKKNPSPENINTFSILIMGGGMGMSYIPKTLKKLVELDNININVVCGKNRHLKNSLEFLYAKDIMNGKVNIYGFTDKIPDLMDVSDIIITKPGGLTSSEAIRKNIPMVIPFAIPGQEEENSEVLEKQGIAARAQSADDLVKVVEFLKNNPEHLHEMKIKMSKVAKDYSLEKTVDLCHELTANK